MKLDYQITVTILTLTTFVCSQQCNKKEFIPLAREKYSPGEKVSSLGPMTHAQCERACRLTPECGAYLMTWLAAPGTGFCELNEHVRLSPCNLQGDTTFYGQYLCHRFYLS